jgi:predicted dehydrogenase
MKCPSLPSSSYAQTARQAATEFKVPHAFHKHLDLLKIPKIDLVVVTVKVPQRFELVSAALKAGKSVHSH